MGPRVLVIGGGAIGGVLAARLALHGHSITVLDTNEKHVELMRDPGLSVDMLGRVVLTQIDAVSSSADLQGTYDFGLITLKAPFVQSALEPLVRAKRIKTYVSLGNGLVQDLVRDVVGDQEVIVGIVSWGATNLRPGHIHQTSMAPIILGTSQYNNPTDTALLATILESASAVEQTSDIEGLIWSKLLLNSCFSGLSVVTGSTYEEVLQLPHGPEVAMAVWTEGFHIAAAKELTLHDVAGIAPRDVAVLVADDVKRSRLTMDRLMKTVGRTKASMLQDIEKGVVTEVDIINGGVVTTGKLLGIPTPLNTAIVKIVHEYEAGVAHPSPARLSDLVLAARATLPASLDYDVYDR